MPKFSVRDLSMAFILVTIWIFFSIVSPSFLSPSNLSNLAIELSITATLALGMLLVILPGMIDLSVGSGVGLIGGLSSVLIFHHNLPAPAAMGIGIVIAIILWSLMGTLIIKQRVPSFIITLGGLLIFKGLFWLVIENSTVPVTQEGQDNFYSLLTTYYFPFWMGYAVGAAIILTISFKTVKNKILGKPHDYAIGCPEITFLKLFVASQAIFLLVLTMNSYRGLPLSFTIMCLIAWAIYILTKHTPWGRHLYAIGGNEEAAHLSGINVSKVVISAYTLLGVIVAVTGFLQTAYGGYSTTTVGNLMELDAIAACVIGGASLKGGRGNVFGVLFGALIMATLLNGMTLMAVSPEIKFIARGLVLVGAVWMDVYINKKSK